MSAGSGRGLGATPGPASEGMCQVLGNKTHIFCDIICHSTFNSTKQRQLKRILPLSLFDLFSPKPLYLVVRPMTSEVLIFRTLNVFVTVIFIT